MSDTLVREIKVLRASAAERAHMADVLERIANGEANAHDVMEAYEAYMHLAYAPGQAHSNSIRNAIRQVLA